MFSTDKQMGYQCFVSFFDLRDPSQIGAPQLGHRTGAEVAQLGGGEETTMVDTYARDAVSPETSLGFCP